MNCFWLSQSCVFIIFSARVLGSVFPDCLQVRKVGFWGPLEFASWCHPPICIRTSFACCSNGCCRGEKKIMLLERHDAEWKIMECLDLQMNKGCARGRSCIIPVNNRLVAWFGFLTSTRHSTWALYAFLYKGDIVQKWAQIVVLCPLPKLSFKAPSNKIHKAMCLLNPFTLAEMNVHKLTS